MQPSFVIRLSCKNRPGIVAGLSTQLYQAGFNIQESQQFDDPNSDRFFIRMMFNRDAEASASDVRILLKPVVDRFGMDLTVHDGRQRRRVLLLVSKQDHCLVDLLYRQRSGDLDMDVVGIVSNHPRATYAHVNFGDIPFHHLPVQKESRSEQEALILAVVEHSRADLIVLARYMQVLSDDLTLQLQGRCINIHHSFLPGFKGAKPYHQAFERGVKMIGATAHFVTADLDEGPIIAQDVESISHRDQPDELVRKGRDIERRVLARAVRYYIEDRVLLNGGKTVVFPE